MRNKELRKVSYFDTTGEVILDFISKLSDLPEDAKLIKLEFNPNRYDFRDDIDQHIIRFIVYSEKYREATEGDIIPQVDPTFGAPKDRAKLLDELSELRREYNDMRARCEKAISIAEKAKKELVKMKK